MKILLTNAVGFLGKNFIELYGKKHSIRTDQPDLSDLPSTCKFFRDNKFDAVVHTEGLGRSDYDESVNARDLIRFRNLQYAAILAGVKKLIVAGDESDFDVTARIDCVREEDFGQSIPTDNYGLTRYLITLLAAKDKISTTLRFFNMYGIYQRERDSALMEIFSRSLTGKKEICLENNKSLSCIFSADAAKIIHAFLTEDFPKGDYNVAANKSVTLMDAAKLSKKLGKAGGRELTVRVKSTAEDLCTCDTIKFNCVLPAFKFTSLGTGFNKCYEYYLKHKQQLK